MRVLITSYFVWVAFGVVKPWVKVAWNKRFAQIKSKMMISTRVWTSSLEWAMLMCHLDVKEMNKGITCSCFQVTLMPIFGGSICVNFFHYIYQSGHCLGTIMWEKIKISHLIIELNIFIFTYLNHRKLNLNFMFALNFGAIYILKFKFWLKVWWMMEKVRWLCVIK